MLKKHEIDELKGKVSQLILERYNVDYENILLSSLVAGFHRVYGLKNEGIAMSMEIVSDLEDDSENLWKRNILVWNLYILTRELIDYGQYDEALKMIDRLEKNWSRDIILGDEIGFYHVSWIEQVWIRKAEVFLLLERFEEFESLTDKILKSRIEFFEKAKEFTDESIIGDRCTYSCFELMAIYEKKRDINKAISLIEKAIINKKGSIEAINSESPDAYFDKCLEKYFNLQDLPFDNCVYGYCRTCLNYDRKGRCIEFNLSTDEFKSCSNYKS